MRPGRLVELDEGDDMGRRAEDLAGRNSDIVYLFGTYLPVTVTFSPYLRPCDECSVSAAGCITKVPSTDIVSYLQDSVPNGVTRAGVSAINVCKAFVPAGAM